MDQDQLVEAAIQLAQAAERVKIALNRFLEAQEALDKADVSFRALRAEANLIRIAAQIECRGLESA